MEDPILQRAQLLFQQGRFDMAADVLREALLQSPGDAYAHALLGLCLVNQKQYEEATAEAQAAIHQAPDFAFCHYTLGYIYQQRNRFTEAEQAAREALRLRPSEATYWSLLSQTMITQMRWKEALEAADHGLESDPEHNDCLNLRAMALIKLGKNTDAAQTMAGALQRNPHSSLTHASQGWALLHANDPKKALEHFREALRLDPGNQWAREGTMAALKARHLLYRMMLRYYLWMTKFNRRAQWGIILGLWLSMQVLRAVEANYPQLGIVIFPLIVGYALFVLAGWLADPVFNLTLLASRFGRYLLTRVQLVGALVVGILLVGAIVLVPIGFFTTAPAAVLLAGVLMALLTLPTAATARCRVGMPLALMCGYTCLVALAGVAGIALMQADQPSGEDLFLAAVWGSFLSSLASNALQSIVPKK